MNARRVPELDWGPKAVAVRLEEAADTLARLPACCGGGYSSTWPEIVRGHGEAFGPDASARPIPPSPEAIDRTDEALGWLCWLQPEERRIVWLRAEGLPWKRITYRLGIGRTTAWQRWTLALLKVATRLNAVAEQRRPNITPLNKSRRIVLEPP